MGWEQFLGIVLVGIVFLIFYLASILEEKKHDILKYALIGMGVWFIYYIIIIAVKVIETNSHIDLSILHLLEGLLIAFGIVAIFISFYLFFFMAYNVYLMYQTSLPGWKKK